jgi:carboxypeptidase C (cathepsin A)
MNNTYGIQAMNESYYQAALEAVPICRNLSATCVALADEHDPQGYGNIEEVNKACLTAYTYCFEKLHDGYNQSLNYFDITAPKYPIAFPSKSAAGYFNSAEAQAALGVPLNFTGNSVPISEGFFVTGDFARGHGLAALRNLLDNGANVALVYGDRDYQCNWLGGEAISEALSDASPGFAAAGYAQIETNETYVGGLVRQAGKLSFSRVFQSGHEVPYYQPETALQIFNRVMLGADVATGTASASGYVSEGLASAWSESEVAGPGEEAECYVWDILETCTPAQVAVLASGKAITKDFILVGTEE